MKSISGYVFKMVVGAIHGKVLQFSWQSKLLGFETIIVSSTMQEEFVACYEAIIQAVWLKNFIS